MFEELSFNMSTIFNVIQRNKSTFKFDMLFQQVKSILMEESTENKQRHVSSTVTNMNNVGNGGDMTEIDPASRGFNYGVPESDDFLDPMFYVKQQILSTIVCAICIPNSLITLSASEVLHGLFDQCSSLVISLLTHSSENQLPTYLHTILAPYIQGTDISSRSTSTRNKNSVSLIQKLDLKERITSCVGTSLSD
ncbi:unnamed protein product [Schistosoma curassoni]|uniref:Mon2_C domain-containing protein n=1 Tax=Schistosoma curassoni TaxID=6186 RepID=A0A183KTG2_9TREM|nr:unnamed protein product [Schistosoma curassoni]